MPAIFSVVLSAVLLTRGHGCHLTIAGQCCDNGACDCADGAKFTGTAESNGIKCYTYSNGASKSAFSCTAPDCEPSGSIVVDTHTSESVTSDTYTSHSSSGNTYTSDNSTSTSETTTSGSSVPWWAWVLLVLVCLGLIGGLAYYFMQTPKKAPQKKKKRAVKASAPAPALASAPAAAPEPAQAPSVIVAPPVYVTSTPISGSTVRSMAMSATYAQGFPATSTTLPMGTPATYAQGFPATSTAIPMAAPATYAQGPPATYAPLTTYVARP